MNWIKLAKPSTLNPEKQAYYLSDLMKVGQLQQLGEHLWAIVVSSPEDWKEWAIFEWQCSDENLVETTMLVSGCGPTGYLKECRHTYWGENGYIFYPNAEHLKLALNWLETMYEME